MREVKAGLGYRVYQLQKSGNRHLIDIRTVEHLPSFKRIEGVLVIAPVDLIAQKVIAFHKRRGKPKAGTDWRDIAMLLLTFPEFKENPNLVANTLQNAQASAEILAAWQDLAQQDIQPADDDDF